MKRHTCAEAAAVLRVEVSWPCQHIKRLPHSNESRVVTFSDADLECIDQIHHHEPTTGPLAPVPSAPAGARASDGASSTAPVAGSPVRTG